MASIRARKDSGLLFLDFRYHGERCREQTLLPDTPGNRGRLQKLADRLEKAINQGTCTYSEFFPDSRRAKAETSQTVAVAKTPSAPAVSQTPLFSDFAELWRSESEPRWRKRYQTAIRETLDRQILPYFGGMRLAEIDRAILLGFQAQMAKRPGRRSELLSGKRINKLMALVKCILNEGCDRYGLTSPGRGIKPLKQKRSDVQPFTLEEVDKLIATVREDYRPYLTVRLLTGLRTGEANGLQWCDIDFEKDTLRVERTLSRDGDGETKTEGSKRYIPLVPQVRDALLAEKTKVMPGCPWVFHSKHGNPVDLVNFTNRVWYPLLRHLAFKSRPPYQMRHTAATLMLAAGENPEWVASILGHSTTEMLFRVYSRFIPNLTRNDGRAFAGLLNARNAVPEKAAAAAPDLGVLANLSQEQKAALMAELVRQLQTT